ncbi:MAG TPA: hypothetical protein VIM12_12395 [Noviherbaspirillum sp.]|jgi:hypothetical protein|uniref:hypothetical protein n=1 Tax=Noviherbaspirillum sp. TaxID=1926288 RepID=UPI002F9258DA
MSVFDGQRIASKRVRILAYCEQHAVSVPPAFHQLETIYPIAVVDISIPQRPRLLPTTLYNTKGVVEYLKDENKYPGNYTVLDFERGFEYVLVSPIGFERGPAFDNRKDADEVR